MPSIVDKSSVKMICVDDFALRKRFSYGTVMINLENHRIIDMIPSRDTNDVCNWLKTFHNIEVISRDGAITYASAATNSHPDVIQISDRFHLIKGLSEVVCKYIFREFPARVEIPLTESITDEMKALYNTANRSLRIKFSHEKRRKGLTISDIALLLHSSPKTIQKYLAIPEDQVPKSKEIARERQHQLAVKQKEQEIEEARQMALAGIHDIICKKGYTGSVASLRMFMQKERTRMYEQNETEKPHSEYVQRKSLCQLVYKKLEDIGTITVKQYQEVLKKYPLLSELYTLTKDFCNVIFSKKPTKLDEWINAAQKYDIPELQTFINGIKKDITAVKNGIIYSYNNGLAEGSVNKIKVIKRIMYGRNSFELLKAKVLFGELFHVKFN